MGNSELDECVNCGAGIIKASDICPQCGWQKNTSIEPDITKDNVVEDIEEDSPTHETTVVKNKIFRPTGVKFISISYMVFGISLILFGIVFVSAVMFFVMSDTMGELGGIGGGMGNMPMLPGMNGMDASTKESLDYIIDLNRIAGSPSANEMEIRLSSSGIMNMDVMMEILKEASVIALIEIIVGLVIFVIGICLAKGKKWARPVTIISSIMSIPLVIAFVTVDTLVLLGMAAFNGIIIYYMLKPKVRDYFNQTSPKKSKMKKVVVKESVMSESEIKESKRPWYRPPDKEVNVRRMIIYSFLPLVSIYAGWRIKKFWVLLIISIGLGYGGSALIPVSGISVGAITWVAEIVASVYIVRHFAMKYNENILKLNG